MKNIKIESALANYASNAAQNIINDSAIENAGLNHIIHALDQFASANDNEAVLTTEEAQKYFVGPRYADSDKQYPDTLQPETIAFLKNLAQEIVILFVKNDDTHVQKALEVLTHELWPLYSRHADTDSIGFDLQEYADFFRNSPKTEKVELAQRMLNDWNIQIK